MSRRDFERPKCFRETPDASKFVVVQTPLTAWKRIWNRGEVRKGAILALLAVAWELYALKLDNALLFPMFSPTLVAL